MKKEEKKTDWKQILGGGTGIYTVIAATISNWYSSVLTHTTSDWYSTVHTHTLWCFLHFCTLISVVLCLQNVNIESLCQ